ncbi:MAG: hypothetical protein R3C10_12315 [Pirellulales bacterium]
MSYLTAFLSCGDGLASPSAATSDAAEPPSAPAVTAALIFTKSRR